MTAAAVFRTIFLAYDARRDPKTDLSCIVCQKDLNPTKPYRTVHVVAGGSQVLHPDDEQLYIPDKGDCGCHPIGPDCAKKLGLEWSWPA